MMFSDSDDELIYNPNTLEIKTILYKDNPYIKPYVSNENQDQLFNSTSIYLPDNTKVYIPRNYLYDAIYTNKISKGLQILSITNCIINSLYCFVPNGIYYYALVLSSSIYEYIIIPKFTKKHMCFISFYSFIQSLLKSILMIWIYILLFTDSLQDGTIKTFAIIIIQTSLTGFQYIYNYCVYDFYILLKNVPDHSYGIII